MIATRPEATLAQSKHARTTSRPHCSAELLEARIAPATIVVTNTNDSGTGSLRQAILQSNATEGDLDTIVFNIPGPGVRTINLTGNFGPLPEITDPVVIDGYSQPGASANTLSDGLDAVLLIELSGANLGAGPENHGLLITAGSTTIQGLVIKQFDDYGIVLRGGSGNRIQGNFIGSNADGLTAPLNQQFGILVEDSSGNLIGGLTPESRNLVSGNNGNGIEILAISPTGSMNNVIQGNWIGVNRTGNAALGNGPLSGGVGIYTQGGNTQIGGTAPGAGNIISGNFIGVVVDQPTSMNTKIEGNLIGTNRLGNSAIPNRDSGVEVLSTTYVFVGGSTPGAGNVISGNAGIGVFISGVNAGAVVQGNLIGTTASGTVALGNQGDGVFLSATSGAIIGGTAVSEGNTIAFNGGSGVKVQSGGTLSVSNLIRFNLLHQNGGLGIDLVSTSDNSDGVAPNDNQDGDDGANGLQNYPVLTSATRSAGFTNVSGTLNSTPLTDFFIDFYASPEEDESGFGEGQIFLGDIGVTTNESGNVSFNFNPGLLAPPPGWVITAIATTQLNGNTSEFSAGITMTGTFVWDNDSGDGDWFNPLNWDLDSGVPDDDDTAILDINSTIFLSEETAVKNFVQSNGTLQLVADVILTSEWLDWTGGVMTGPGRSLATSFLSISGSGTKSLANGFTLETSGMGVLSGGGSLNLSGSAVLRNTGVFDIPDDSDVIGAAGSVVNTGTFGKIGTGTTTTIAALFVNTGDLLAGSGTLEFTGAFSQTSGHTQLIAGSIAGGINLSFQGGELTGAGSITATITNSGAVIRPGGSEAVGTITINGNFVQTTGGTLEIELTGTAPGAFDVLAVTGTATLGGTLTVLELGSFTIPTSASFTVLTYNSRGGLFAQVNVPPVLALEYQANALVLTTDPAEPEVTLTITDAVFVEGNSGVSHTLVFTLTLDTASSLPVIVSFATGDYSSDARNATAGTDYQPLSGTVTFAPGEVTQTIEIAIVGDGIAEPRERFIVSLSGAEGATLGDGEAIGVILDDDHHLFAAAEGNGNSFSAYLASEGGAVRIETINVFASSYQGGVRVAVGDVTGDGVDDIIAGGGNGTGGKVVVYDGLTFEPLPGVLGGFSAFGRTYRGGVYVAAGDINSDGFYDVIVGAAAGSSNQVRIYSGADGSLLNAFRAFPAGSGGVRVGAGDVDGDGRPDVIVGSGVGSTVRSFNGLDGSFISQSSFRALAKSYRGGIFVSAGDVNGDGIDDIVTSAGTGTPTIRTFLQDTSSAIPHTFKAYDGRALRGVRVSSLDINGDGVADIIASRSNGGDGKVSVFSGMTSQPLYTFTAFPGKTGGVYVG